MSLTSKHRAHPGSSESGNLKEQVISHQEIECPLEFSVRRSLATCGVTPLEAVNKLGSRPHLLVISSSSTQLHFFPFDFFTYFIPLSIMSEYCPVYAPFFGALVCTFFRE